MVMRVVLGVLGIMTGTVRHQYSRAGRTQLPYGRICGTDLTFSWLIFSECNRSIRRLQRPDGGKYVVGVAVDFHMAPDADDPAILADQHGGAKNALEGPAIHGFFAPDAIGLQHPMLLIRDERSFQLMSVSKGFLRLHGVGRNAQYRGVTFGECAR